MVEVVDGRKSAGIGTVSKRRFTERVKRHAKRAIYKSIEEGNITDISEKGVDVSIERDDTGAAVSSRKGWANTPRSSG